MTAPTNQSRTCRICGSRDDHPAFSTREMMIGLREEFVYFQCSSCQCLQIDRVPEHPERYYPATYYSYTADPSAESRLTKLIRNRRAQLAMSGGALGRFLLRRFPNHALAAFAAVHPPRTASVLDVGSGAGAFIYRLGEIGYTRVMGIDPYLDRDIRFSSGVTVRRGHLEDVEGLWNVIMLTHAFEHMSDPANVLRSVAKRLQPGGTCIISIPIVPSAAWKEYGTDWVQLDAPRHLFLHSTESMRILAASAGLRIARTIYDSTGFQFWGSEQYRKDIPLTDPRSYAIHPGRSLFTRTRIREFERRAQQRNAEGTGDQCSFLLTFASEYGVSS